MNPEPWRFPLRVSVLTAIKQCEPLIAAAGEFGSAETDLNESPQSRMRSRRINSANDEWQND